MEEWGEPETAERYRKAHRVIRVLASSAKTLGNQEKAAADWEDLHSGKGARGWLLSANERGGTKEGDGEGDAMKAWEH